MQEDGVASRLWSRVDEPVDGQELSIGSNLLRGWAFHEARRVDEVHVLVDGRTYAVTTPGDERSDVAAEFPAFEAAAESGWRIELDGRDLTPGSHELTVLAVLEAGMQQPGGLTLGRRVVLHTLSCTMPHGEDLATFEVPAVVPTGSVRVRGLARARGGLARAEITVNGSVAVPARVALPGCFDERPGRVTVPEDLVAGFEAVVPVETGPVVLAGHAVSLRGDRFEIEPSEVTSATPDWPPDDPALRAAAEQRLQDRVRRLTAPRGPDQEPRVLVVAHDLGVGGAQLYLQELLRRLRVRGVTCAVTSPRSGPLGTELDALGCPVQVTGPYDVKDPDGYDGQRLQIASFAAEQGCNVVIANTVTVSAGVDAAHLMGLPVVWSIHESVLVREFWARTHPPPYVHPHVVERTELALERSERVVFVSEATRELYERTLTPGASVVVAYGVDIAGVDAYRAAHSRQELRRRLGVAGSTLLLLVVGLVEPRKGQLGLVQAFAASRLVGQDVVLAVVGATEGTAYVEALHGYVEGAGLADQVRVVPMQADIYQWYGAGDALICASDNESLPRTMLEAMLFELPVGSTRVFGIPELVTEDESGFLCEPGDIRELAALLERVADAGPERLAELGRRAREVVQARHDPAVYADYFYDELVRLATASADATR